MFFIDDRIHFFKPLTGKYREHVRECLCLLYSRQYGSSADYGHSLTRSQIIEILEEALIQLGDVSFEQDDLEKQDLEIGLSEERFKNSREQANWVLKQLLEFGWVERQVDTATLQSAYPFSRMGRVFSQSLLDAGNSKIRTRHRNTRNTLNALDAFASRGEIYDLLDAFDYSERIVTDFTDVISELEEKKRALVQEMESQQLIQQAAEQFFDFMEKRFQPDIQVRLSADSVEKHRDHIDKRLRAIRRKSDDFKKVAEGELRRMVPGLCEPHQSYLYFILDTIERRMHNAADIMLPALRRALHGFTKRADIIIRQLSYLNTQKDSDLIEVCRELADLSAADYQQRLNKASEATASFKLRLIDPQHIRLSERKSKDIVDNTVAQQQVPNKEAQCELMVQQLLDQAFVMNSQAIKDYVMNTLRDGRKLSTKELQINNSDDLLAMAHAIEISGINNLSSDFKFNVERKNNIASNEYYQRFDEHEIELIDQRPLSEKQT